jgi:hypothetical protein
LGDGIVYPLLALGVIAAVASLSKIPLKMA